MSMLSHSATRALESIVLVLFLMAVALGPAVWLARRTHGDGPDTISRTVPDP
jgi:hypothetical protein